MRLVKMFGLAALAAVVTTAFVGATSASALSSTQLCDEHVGLECPEEKGTKSVHLVLEEGTVGKLLNGWITVLCLGVLIEATPLALAEPGEPQLVHVLKNEYTGCGTGSAHDDCTTTLEQLPLAKLLKFGLDSGFLSLSGGSTRLKCPGQAIDCLYDFEGVAFGVGGQHLTAEKTQIAELGNSFFCPQAGTLDGLLETLENTYILK